MLQKQTYPTVDDFQVVPLWFPDIFPDHVWKYGISDLSGGIRGEKLGSGYPVILDLQGALEFCLYRRTGAGMGSTV